jgi:P27 family predicted phage terminase small subunit
VIQLAKGTWRAKKRPGEPTDAQGTMVKPDWLGPIARAVWDRQILVLRARGCESPAYSDFLALYSQAHQDLHDATALIAADGVCIVSEKTGGQYLHPAVALKNKAVDTIARFGREFGFSPTSIRDIQAGTPPDKNADKKRKYFG